MAGRSSDSLSRNGARWAGVLGASLLFLAGSAEAGGTRTHNVVLLTVSATTAKGQLRCGVYQRGGWLKRTVKNASARFQGNTATCRFADLEPGTYAVGAYQDENSNGKLDRGFAGLPKEPWCVSRGPRGTIGPPSFDAAKFSVSEGTVSLRCTAR